MTYASFQVISLSCFIYQVYVDFGMAQSSSTSITGHHSGFNISHWLLCHQIDSKVLVYLNTNNSNSVNILKFNSIKLMTTLTEHIGLLVMRIGFIKY